MSPRPKNSTREKTAEKKEKILDSAMDIFAEKGFDGANMRQIASAADVNKYMLYYHFEDKKTLFEQVLETVSRPIFSRLTAAVNDADNLETAIGDVFDIYSSLMALRDGKIRSFLARELAVGAPRIGPLLRIKGPDIIRLWEPKLVDHLQRDDLPYQDVVRSVVFIMSTLAGTFLTEPVTQNILDVYGLTLRDPDHKQLVVNIIVGGIEYHFAYQKTLSNKEI